MIGLLLSLFFLVPAMVCWTYERRAYERYLSGLAATVHSYRVARHHQRWRTWSIWAWVTTFLAIIGMLLFAFHHNTQTLP
jgi:hypothetical protein